VKREQFSLKNSPNLATGSKNVDIRRAAIPYPQNYAGFLKSLVETLELAKRQHFADKLDKLRISYDDDEGDSVTISNDADLREALRQLTAGEDTMLRLNIVVMKGRPEVVGEDGSPARSRCGRHFHGHGHGHRGGHPLMQMLSQFKSQLPELLSNPSLRAMAEGLIGQTGLVRIDTGRICDQCNTAIMGDRYASTTQPDFDLCAKCMLAPGIGPALNNVHKFNKIAAFDALLQCLQEGGNVEALFERDEAAAPARHCAVCDICSSSIQGVRHKCFECPDYDECAKCRATSKHPHAFYEISDVTVRQIPAEAVQAYKAKQEAAKAEEAALEA